MLRHRCRAVASRTWGLPLRLACRQQAYSPSAWSAFTSASLSRHFHCTLKESLAKKGAEPEAAAAATTEKDSCGNSISENAATTPADVGPSCKATTSCTSAAPTHQQQAVTHTHTSTPLNAFKPSASSLRYSLELSLPHLPDRTPLVKGCNTISAAALYSNNTSKNSSTVEKDRVVRALAPWLTTRTAATSKEEESEPTPSRWASFVRLCDAVVATAASHASSSSSAATTAASCGLTGVTIPCKEPYFCAAGRDDGRSSTSKEGDAAPLPSTIQAAVWLFHQQWHVPVTLALNTTVANRCAADSTNEDVGRVGGDSAGATESGIQAVVRDFAENLGGRTVLLVRGDAPSTQYGLEPEADTAAAADRDASKLRTSGDLVRCVSGVSGVRMAVAGYPQGHPLERQWESAVATTTAAAGSDSFFTTFEKNFNAADSLFGQVVESHIAAASPHAQLPALFHLFHTLGRLHAVRMLWLTPSHYPAAARAASARQLVEDKVLLLPLRPLEGGARVVVTQMLASAQEFTTFTADVQRALREAATSTTPVSVKIVPGVLLPHPTNPHVLLRSLYYAKVIPSVRLQRALENYRTDLKSVWRSIVTHNNTADKAHEGAADAAGVTRAQDVAGGYRSTWPGHVVLASEHDAAAIEAFVTDAHQRAMARFTTAWLAETVDLLCELQQPPRSFFTSAAVREGTPVHFFTMFNDQVDVRLAQLLEAYAKRQPQLGQCGARRVA